jgi:hypothetical protein
LAKSPDYRVLRQLRREIGEEILRKDPRTVLPRNKKLDLRQLVALARFHYAETYGATGNLGSEPAYRRNRLHIALFERMKSSLVRYGFDGFGDPASDIGILILASDRVRLCQVVLAVPEPIHERHAASLFSQFSCIGDLGQFSRNAGWDEISARSPSVARPHTSHTTSTTNPMTGK